MVLGFQFHGWAVIGLLSAIKNTWGRGTVSALQDGLCSTNKETLQKKIHASSKYDSSLVVELLLELEKGKGDGTGSAFYRAGRGAGLMAIEVMFPVYKSMENEERFFNSFPKLWDRMMEDAGTVEVSVAANKALVKICGYPSREELWSRFWEGWLVGAVETACGSKDVTTAREMFADSKIVRHEFQISW